MAIFAHASHGDVAEISQFCMGVRANFTPCTHTLFAESEGDVMKTQQESIMFCNLHGRNLVSAQAEWPHDIGTPRVKSPQ